jgi:integrase
MSDERREFGYLKQRGRIWWLRYRVDGVERWESLKTTSLKVAEKKRTLKEAELERGEDVTATAKRLTFGDMTKKLEAHFTKVKNASWDRAAYAIAKHLEPYFGAYRARAITEERVAEYETFRTEEGASRATLNYELALLRKMFRLSRKSLRHIPDIQTPDPKNARVGFFEPEDFVAVLAELPEDLRPVMELAYVTGWRVKSELLPLTWDRVDLKAGIVRLERYTTKNTEARDVDVSPVPAILDLLKRQRDKTTELEREQGRMIRHVFHRKGKPIIAYDDSWHAACRRAAVEKRGNLEVVVRPQLIGRIVHDFRRTAVRNLVRAGVSERVAMDITGHKTRAVFDRYNITSAADKTAAMAKLNAFLYPADASRGTIGGQSAISGNSSENRRGA